MGCANRDAIYRIPWNVLQIAPMESKRNSIGRSPIRAERVRKIDGGFSFIPHRFLHEGFFASLSRDELLLYFFLVSAGDRNGVSFYGLDAICTLLDFTNDTYLVARKCLIEKDLLAFDGRRFQVLSLPKAPCHKSSSPLETQEDFEERDPSTIRRLLHREFGGAKRHEAAK
jgi:hypothetical protein